MRKIVIALFLVIMMTSPALADFTFTNGGFESGNLNGWTIDYGARNSGAQTVNWAASYPSGGAQVGLIGTDGKVVVSSGYVRSDEGSLPGTGVQTIAITPYVGNYMAILNNSYGNYHASRITQTSTAVSTADLLNSEFKVYVDWGAALVEPTNATNHDPNNFPFFEIDIYRNAIKVDSFTINSHNAASSGWANIGYDNSSTGGTIYYKSGQFVYNILGGGWIAGDTMKIDMFVADCGLGGHGAYAFLDGIGTVKPPVPPGVPEPATLLLLGFGLAGLATLRKKL